MDPQSPSSDLEDCDCDDQYLLSHEPANIFVLLLNIGLVLMMSVPRTAEVIKDTQGVRLPHSDWIAPARELELQAFDDKFGIHGLFRGKPRPELDRAWAEPVRNYTVRIPNPGWLVASSPARVLTEFQDEKGGIMGTFSFLHNLHCLKTIRQYMLPEYYPETAEKYKAIPEEPIPEHIDHCIDMLRQSKLCHADMSLMAFEWHEDESRPVDIHHAQHVCANTEKVNRFLEANSVPPFGSILIHPWTGVVPYPY